MRSVRSSGKAWEPRVCTVTVLWGLRTAFLTFASPQGRDTSSLLLKGLHNYAGSFVGLLFTLGQYFLKLLDFQMRIVYSGSDLIWSAEFSGVWRVFLTLGLLFVVLNILLQFHPVLGKTNTWKHCFLWLFFRTSVPSGFLESQRQSLTLERKVFMSQCSSSAYCDEAPCPHFITTPVPPRTVRMVMESQGLWGEKHWPSWKPRGSLTSSPCAMILSPPQCSNRSRRKSPVSLTWSQLIAPCSQQHGRNWGKTGSRKKDTGTPTLLGPPPFVSFCSLCFPLHITPVFSDCFNSCLTWQGAWRLVLHLRIITQFSLGCCQLFITHSEKCHDKELHT